MPENIKALLVILTLSYVLFFLTRKPACFVIETRDFIRRRNLWFLITAFAFLITNFWVFALATSFLLLFLNKQERNPSALFLLLLFTAPVVQFSIPAFGLVNYLFTLTHQRLLAIVILLPALIKIVRERNHLPFGRITADKILIIYIFLSVILYLRETSATDTLRQALYHFLNIFLPYFIVSRTLTNLKKLEETMTCLMLAIMILALIATFEALNYWLLYTPVENHWGYFQGFSRYGESRLGLQRPEVSVKTIPFGYLMAIGIGIYLYLKKYSKTKFLKFSGPLLLVTGLLVSLSRGPWMGGAALILCYVLTGRNALKHTIMLATASFITIIALSVTPSGKSFLDFLPYLGDSGQETINYRESLLENSIIVIKRNLWFGSTDYLNTPEMEAMRQGQGIIDLVNTYIQVALETGITGLALFCGFFCSVLLLVHKKTRRAKAANMIELYELGRAIIAIIMGILLIIFTVSSVSIIPIMYWAIAGLGVAYSRLPLESSSLVATSNQDKEAPLPAYSAHKLIDA